MPKAYEIEFLHIGYIKKIHTIAGILLQRIRHQWEFAWMNIEFLCQPKENSTQSILLTLNNQQFEVLSVLHPFSNMGETHMILLNVEWMPVWVSTFNFFNYSELKIYKEIELKSTFRKERNLWSKTMRGQDFLKKGLPLHLRSRKHIIKNN